MTSGRIQREEGRKIQINEQNKGTKDMKEGFKKSWKKLRN